MKVRFEQQEADLIRAESVEERVESKGGFQTERVKPQRNL